MLWVLLVVLIPIIYFLLSRPYKYWSQKGVDDGKPIPIFGHSMGIVLRTQSLCEMIQMVYNINPTARYCGMYQFFKPSLVLRDPDLIQQLIVRDSDCFLNHRGLISEDCDPLWGKTLFSLTDQKWRDMRGTLSPAFTSNKLKHLYTLITERAENFVGYFLAQNKGVIKIEMKDAATRFTNDVIADAAFGVKCNSLEEPDNEFYLMGIETTSFKGFWKSLRIIGFLIFPQILKFFRIHIFSKRVADFFTKLVRENIQNREKYKIVRPDIIHLLLEARKDNQKSAPSDEDITAQALIFFFGGFETVSTLISFMSYELAVNPDVQEKLRQEVDKVSEPTYDTLINMKYMNMVVSETQRLWANGVATDRICSKPYTIESKTSEEKTLLLEKDAVVLIPIFALHRDPNHFPEPTRFDPERFNDENKGKIKPYTYLPFGVGPRNCIGSRLALLESKIFFFHLLSKFEIVPTEKTDIPLRLSRKSFNVTAENGFWLALKRRI